MGYPELEPVVFTNSSFGAGQYPIVYSNFACGGWEDSLGDCSKIVNPHFNCSRKNVAGVLCGYDCNDGDVRLVGSEWSYEGTIEICYGNVWGLISDSSWNQPAAEVVCRQLGYQTQGTIPYYGSHFSKPNKTIHLSSVFCTGSEDMLNECTLSSLSLQMGKEAIAGTDVAGVKCYTPDQCVPPPLQGTACINGNIRLTGGQPFVAEGNLEYCYHGSWSLFCYLGHTEAIVACRQLGYTQYDITSIINDGRFGQSLITSLFQNITCGSNIATTYSLSNCIITDRCQSRCQYPYGIFCYEPKNCQEGAVRLVNGTSSEAGRLEVCSNGIWGSVCGKGFDVTDAYVVCRELGFGISEPIVYTNSYFGDGNEAIIYSNLECGGYEGTISDCPKQSYGSFSCSRNNVAGLICSDDCLESDLRLVFGRDPYEGTIEVCHYNTWGLISDVGWSDNEAEVICRQMNYSTTYAVGLVESYYGKPNRNVQLVDIVCNGTEERLEFCESTLLTPEEVARFHRSNVAGVNCMPRNEINITTTTPLPSGDLTPCEAQPCYCPCTPIIMITLIVLLLVSVIIIISCCICVLLKHYQLKKRSKNRLTVNMQSLNENENENPLSIIGEEDDLQNELYDVINSSDKNKLVLK
jgi:deleted-in-malignant-brain-tumors protein 1